MSRKSRLEEKRQRQAKGTNIGDPNNPGGAPRKSRDEAGRVDKGRKKNRR